MDVGRLAWLSFVREEETAQAVPAENDSNVARGAERSEYANHASSQLHPVVPPHVSHFKHVPLRTSVKFAHSGQASPS